MQKILFFLPNLDGGGAERVIVNMIRQLDNQKFDIFLVLVDDRGVYRSLVPDYVGIHNLGLKKTILSILKLRKLIKDIRPDIIFSTLLRTHIALYMALFGIKKKPLIILRSPNSPKLLLEKQELNKVMMFFLGKVYACADIVLAQTPEMREEMIKYHRVLESKVEVFLNPVDTDLIDEKIKKVKNPFDSKRVNVVAAGRLTQQKGFDVLITSFRYVVEKDNNFMLYIIGKDVGEEEHLKKLVCDFNLENNVFFLGFQDNPYKFFFFSDIYVLSSLWEGLPNTVLENLYLQKPIIATKCIPYMNSLIREGENGFLVDVADYQQLADAIINYKNIKNTAIDISKNKNNINAFLLTQIAKFDLE